MSLDGIRVVKKKIPKTHKDYKANQAMFWLGKPGNKNSDIKRVKPDELKESKSGFFNELKVNLLNRRFVLAVFTALLLIGISSVAVFSYKIVKDNYNFIKLFNSGKYLIVFQNNSEMRATGGFIGSFAILEMDNGSFKNYYFDSNIYKRDNEFVKKYNIEPPDKVLANLIGGNRWSMRDANWYVDYPTSAKQIAWFYEQEGGEPVDGIIAVNASFLAELLTVSGPIELPEQNVTITSDNFFDVVQNKVEKDYWNDPINRAINEPKSILKEIAPKIIKKIVDENKYNQAIDLVNRELKEKQILLYFYDDAKEKIARDNGWAGEVKDTNGDYLQVNNSNLGGLKSSLKVNEKIELNTSINSGGAINTLIVTRTHTGDGYWPDGENTNYMRILVPNGSELVSAKIDDVGCINDVIVKKEAGKTVFAIFVNTKPRSTRILSISYKLPKSINENNYSLMLQKQPGNLGDDIKVIVNGTIKYSGYLNEDKEIK